MLIRFIVENYLSFKEPTEFNMLTGAVRRLSHHVYKQDDVEVLKMAAIYGANGAGKSNFVKALLTLKETATGQVSPFYLAESQKFQLEPVNRDKPIRFEIEFIKNEQSFYYELIVNNLIIQHERLSHTNSSKVDDLVFERKTDKNGETKIIFNEKYHENSEDKLRLKLYEEELLNLETSLLSKLSEAKKGFTEVKEAFDWFKNKCLFSITASSHKHWLILKPEILNFSNDFLKLFHIGIEKIEIQSTPLESFFEEDDEKMANVKRILQKEKLVNLSRLFKLSGIQNTYIAVKESDKYLVKCLVVYHRNNSGDIVQFDINKESDGTNRLFDILPMLFYAIFLKDAVVIADEIERSIHPYLLKEIIKKFSEHTDTKGQLIFTTHESNLLDQDILRQDEIWFVEKNKEGATELFPMSDFSVRYDLDIRKGYLNGRFGGIPFLGNFKDLNWRQHAEEQPTY